MSATSNKSRILLFMMAIIALVFFISSFMAATLNGPGATTPGTVAPTQAQGSSCVMVRTGEDRLFSECNFG